MINGSIIEVDGWLFSFFMYFNTVFVGICKLYGVHITETCTQVKKNCALSQGKAIEVQENGVNEYIDDNLIMKYSKGIAIAKDKTCGFGVKMR